MSSVKNSDENVVYRLYYDEEECTYKHIELNTYGLDVNLILEEDMMVQSRDSVIGEDLKNILSL